MEVVMHYVSLLMREQKFSKRISKPQFKVLGLILVRSAGLQRIKVGPFYTHLKVYFSSGYYAPIILTILKL